MPFIDDQRAELRDFYELRIGLINAQPIAFVSVDSSDGRNVLAPSSSYNMVFGDIVAIHCDDWLLDADGAVDPSKIRTVDRLGGLNYCNASDVFDLPRPA